MMEPLQDPKGQIRLLQLLPGAEEEIVWCTSSTHTLDCAPDYLAISYTWGDTNNPQQIGIDDHLRQVLSNCQYALWQARLHHPEALVWIDSVCINQDDLHEKSCQVAMMGKIFAKATKVLACAGAEAEYDDLEYMVNFSPAFTSQALTTTNRIVHVHNDFEPKSSRLSRISCEKLWKKLEAKYTYIELNKFLTACRKFMCRPYWQRLWILQELFMATEIEILCAEFSLSWAIVGNLNMLGSLWKSKRDHDAARRIPASLQDLIGDCHDGLRDFHEPSFLNLSCLRPSCSHSSGAPLQEAKDFLVRLRSLKCVDQRDRIFGTLGLFNWNGSRLSLVPDYSMSAFSLAMSVTILWMPRRAHDLKHLLSLLEIDMNSHEVMDLAANRSQPGYVTTLPRNRRNYEMTWSCAQLRSSLIGPINNELPMGALNCCLKKAHKSPAPRESLFLETVMDVSTRQSADFQKCRLVYTAGEPSAVVPSSARDGDFLVELDAQLKNCLIIRRRWDFQTFEIIGQAFILPPFRMRPSVRCDCGKWGMVHDALKSGTFATTLNVEDILILMVQDMITNHSGEVEYEPSRRLQRLVTRVSNDPNPIATLIIEKLQREVEEEDKENRVPIKREEEVDY